MRVLYAALCESVHERADGRMDVHGIFHQLFAPGFPAEQTDVTLIVLLEWDADEAGRQTFSIDLLDPSGSPIGTINGHTEVAARAEGGVPPRTGVEVRLDRMIFPQPGTYEVALTTGNQQMPLIPLHLILSPEAR